METRKEQLRVELRPARARQGALLASTLSLPMRPFILGSLPGQQKFLPFVFLPLSRPSQEKISVLGAQPFNTQPNKKIKIKIGVEKNPQGSSTPRPPDGAQPRVQRRGHGRLVRSGSFLRVPKFPYLDGLQPSLLFEPLREIKQGPLTRGGRGGEGRTAALGKEQPPAIRLGPTLLPSLAILLPPPSCV